MDPGLRRDDIRGEMDPGLRRDGRFHSGLRRCYEPATFILSTRIEPTVLAP
jgi:hypothetical protein